MVFRGSKQGSRPGLPARQDQPILPPALANSLVETIRATLGYALLAGIALSWAALLTWSVTDPSFTRIGVDHARNLLGTPGAHAADAAIQSLGVAAFALLLAPMFWAVAMVRAEPVRGRLAPIIAYLTGITGLAAASALWRTVPGWPLAHGLGGIGGEHLLTMLAQPLASHVAEQARPLAAGIAGFMGLIATLSACGVQLPKRRRKTATAIHAGLNMGLNMGLNPGHEPGALEPRLLDPRLLDAGFRDGDIESNRAPPSRNSSDTMRWGPSPLEPDHASSEHTRRFATPHHNHASLARPSPDRYHDRHGGAGHGGAGHGGAGHGAASHSWSDHRSNDHGWTGVGPDTLDDINNDSQFASTDRDARRYGPYAATASDPFDRADGLNGSFIVEPANAAESDDCIDFETWTDASSSGMAARFAPAVNAPRALQSTLSSAFGFSNGTSSAARAREANAAVDTTAWRRPSLNLLARPTAPRAVSAYGQSLNRGNGRLITDALAEFGIDGTLRDVEPGPVVTTFLFEIARTTKLSRVIALASDIARHVGVPALRISERRSLVAIEFPNPDRAPVVLRDCLDSEAFRSELDALPIALGLSTTGNQVIADLTQLSGILISGSEPSAKSIGLNAMILSLMYRHGPEDCRFLMIDPGMVDLAIYDGIPHLLTPVVADPHKATTALAWCVREMEERMKRMSFLGVRNIELFNNRVRNAKKRGEILQRTVQTGFDERTGKARIEKQDLDLAPMPYIVIVIEELADLMAVAGREIEGSVARLAKAARAVGIHLIVATDRPTADIVTTPIRESLPARLSYRANGRAESRSVIGDDGAEHLLAGGDSLLSHAGGPSLRVHGPYVSPDETAAVAIQMKERGAPAYVAALDQPTATTHGTSRGYHNAHTYRPAAAPAPNPADELYDRAVAVAVRDGGASISHLQSSLKISAGWAANLLARLEADGVVTPSDARGIHHIRPPGSRVA